MKIGNLNHSFEALMMMIFVFMIHYAVILIIYVPNKQFMEKSPIDIRSHKLNHSSQFSQHNILNNPDGQIQNKLKLFLQDRKS